MFSYYISYERLMFQIHIFFKTIETIIRKQSNERQKYLNKHITKDDLLMIKKNLKGCSTLLVVREMQLKTTN